jgi:hypothetical protein
MFRHISFPFISDISSNSIGTSANWELLAPRGYRFYMPGSVGPAWHDVYTTSHVHELQMEASHQRNKKVQEAFVVEVKRIQFYCGENISCL